MNVADHIVRWSRKSPERAALLFEGRRISYRECDEMSSRAASVFHSAGIRAEDRVALFLPNSPDFITAYLGALKLGAIAVSMNATLTADEVRFLLADCQAKVAVTTPELRERIPLGAVDSVYTTGGSFEAALQAADGLPGARPMAAEDAAAIVYTSGTTGRPKGATLSHANIVRNIEAKRRYLGIRAEDRALLFLPLYHCFGQNAILNAFLQAGATVVLHSRFEFDAVMESIARDCVTMFFGVPTTYIFLLDKISPEDMAAVRYYFSAAAPLPLEAEERWTRKFGVPIFQGYGLTETSPFASYNHLERHRPGSIGTPIDGVEMKIVDVDTDKDAAPGEKGEIVVRGHNVMLGYWNQPAETAKCIRDGWFHTGDIGSFDHEGYFFIEDRLTDMIVSGGVNVYPAEVENVLLAHPAIAEAAVYGAPDPLFGEQVSAAIVLKPGRSLSEAEVRSFCRKGLAPIKAPTLVHFLAEIPKGSTGKPLKRFLRERASAGELAAESKESKKISAGKEEVTHWIHAWLLNNLDANDLDAAAGFDFDGKAAFTDLGVDSILSVRLAKELSEWAGCKVEDSAAWRFPTPEAMAVHIASHSEARPETESDDVLGLPDEDCVGEDLSDEAVDALLLAELHKMNR